MSPELSTTEEIYTSCNFQTTFCTITDKYFQYHFLIFRGGGVGERKKIGTAGKLHIKCTTH